MYKYIYIYVYEKSQLSAWSIISTHSMVAPALGLAVFMSILVGHGYFCTVSGIRKSSPIQCKSDLCCY